MNRLVTFALPALLVLAHTTFADHISYSFPADSVGVERKDGKRFVLHRVDQGQTLYAVARRYNSSVDAIKSANPDLSDNALRYDQLLRVPVATVSLSRREEREAEKALKNQEKEKQKAAREAEPVEVDEPKPTAKAEKATTKTEKATVEKAADKTVVRTANNGVHVVESGQTLYSLAVRYSVTMADIRRWNDLGADGIQVGQSLIVSEKAFDAKKGDDVSTTVSTAKAKPAVTKAAESEPVKLEAKPIVTPEPLPTPGTKPKPRVAETKPAEPKPAEKVEKSAETKSTEPKATSPRSDNEPVANARKPNVKSEVGFADLIEGNDASTKYLALHRSAPVGTLVQVRNDITNQSLYVKIIGKLPDTGINNQVLIRLSGRAFEKLSPNGQRFRAEVSYSN